MGEQPLEAVLSGGLPAAGLVNSAVNPLVQIFSMYLIVLLQLQAVYSDSINIRIISFR